MIRLLKRWRLRNHDRAALVELNELIIKAGRRCAYDMAHAADDVKSGRHPERGDWYRARADGWLDIFACGDDGKNYRHQLHRDIFHLEQEIQHLRDYCEENGLPLPTYAPF